MSKALRRAQALSDLWTDLEDSMGEMAAFHVACEQMNIDPDDGWQLIYKLAEWQEKTGKVEYDPKASSA